MPGLDRTGPAGAGPMTGGRRGLCGRTDSAGTPARYGGFDFGRGLGFGRGHGRGFGPGRCRRAGFGWRNRGWWEGYPGDYPTSRDDEMALLKADADAMKKSLEAVQRRIDELGQTEISE